MALKPEQDHQREPRRRVILGARRFVAPVASVAAISTIVSISGFALANSTATAAAVAPLATFSAGSTSGVLDLTVLGAMGLTAGDISLADAVGATNRASTPRSAAFATNLDGTLLTALPLDILSTTSQVAPPDNPTPATADIIPATDTPVLSLGVSNASASARWLGDNACLPGNVPLTRSRVSTANASVLPIPDAGGAALVDIPEAVAVTQTTSLLEVPNSLSRVVQARARGSVVDLSLLGQISVKVLSEPILTATATGKNGGAKVEYTAPVVTVSLPGAPPVTLPANGSPVDFEAPDNPLLSLELRIGQVRDLVERADGTSASATASVLKVKLSLLPVIGDGGITVAKVDLFPMSVSASAPVGGVTCPPPVTTPPTTPPPTTPPPTTPPPTTPPPTTPPPNPDCDANGQSDFDRDGLTGLEETSGSRNSYANEPTDPCDADSDGDGIKDGTEVFGSKVNDSVADCRRQTKAIGTVITNPNDKDTDNDRLSDGKEINGFFIKQRVFVNKDRTRSYVIGRVHTNPLRKDTDRDGVRDRAETMGTKNKKFNKDKTDPRNCDTDLGGVSDGKEVRKGSNPADRSSSPKHPRGKR